MRSAIVLGLILASAAGTAAVPARAASPGEILVSGGGTEPITVSARTPSGDRPVLVIPAAPAPAGFWRTQSATVVQRGDLVVVARDVVTARIWVPDCPSAPCPVPPIAPPLPVRTDLYAGRFGHPLARVAHRPADGLMLLAVDASSLAWTSRACDGVRAARLPGLVPARLLHGCPGDVALGGEWVAWTRRGPGQSGERVTVRNRRTGEHRSFLITAALEGEAGLRVSPTGRVRVRGNLCRIPVCDITGAGGLIRTGPGGRHPRQVRR